MRRTLLALCIALGSGAALGSEIERVEPPFWWQGFQETELQLMIYGDGIGSTEPSVDHPDVGISRVVRVASPNYLFLYLDIGAAEPDDFDITFTGDGAPIAHRYSLLQKDPDPEHARGFSSKDSIWTTTICLVFIEPIR